MRHIKYIIINDSMPEASRGKSSNIRIDNLGYHYVINSQGEVLNPIDVSNPGAIMSKPVCGQEDLNKCSIGIKYNGSLEPGSLTFELRAKLILLLVELRSRYPEAAIFALNEIRPETRHLKHETRGIIRVRKDMNQLRRELSDMI
ncbi:N-acetylmuramoyl-L-alanine amidase [Prevotella communis]|uniref:N-acetylmuramoyl-L-alanine amidase n=1 Tax=Prevotella communis TaxID=2913614 RepID=A0A1H0KAN3_9BACT|nr:N-acetylmuramoyl-L-alanine amidase [Prevotella communis]SDO53007.1 N-acetylmuramoyl-L-alanine amidase [Prevotella communis]